MSTLATVRALRASSSATVWQRVIRASPRLVSTFSDQRASTESEPDASAPKAKEAQHADSNVQPTTHYSSRPTVSSILEKRGEKVHSISADSLVFEAVKVRTRPAFQSTVGASTSHATCPRVLPLANSSILRT